MKSIYTRKEIPIADYLMTFKQGLIDDFMKGFSTLKEAQAVRCENVLSPVRQGIPVEETKRFLVSRNTTTNKFEPNVEGWRGVAFRFIRDDEKHVHKTDVRDYENYPTASRLLDEFSDYCPMLTYSVIAPNTILHRHTDPDSNKDGQYMRIHIPLIIPEGELFLEVGGEEVRWDDLFGFNTQIVHSAHNYTNYHRLVFLIDLDLEHLGLKRFPPYSDEVEKNIKPFVRGWDE